MIDKLIYSFSNGATRVILLVLFVIPYSITSYGQNTISGEVQTLNGNPIPYVTVAIRSLDSLYSGGGNTDETGHFFSRSATQGTILANDFICRVRYSI